MEQRQKIEHTEVRVVQINIYRTINRQKASDGACDQKRWKLSQQKERLKPREREVKTDRVRSTEDKDTEIMMTQGKAIKIQKRRSRI